MVSSHFYLRFFYLNHLRDKDKQPLYRARHYSVTPLGSRSGLIQWVQGSTPLFSLYKKWQQREAIAATLKTTPGQNANTPAATLPSISRPSEVFYGKLNVALKEKVGGFIFNIIVNTTATN